MPNNHLYIPMNGTFTLTKLIANVNPLSANLTKWSNRTKQIRWLLPTNCLSEFDHFVGLALKSLKEV